MTCRCLGGGGKPHSSWCPNYYPSATNTEELLASAVDRLRDIAATKYTSKRQKVNSELAVNWLLQHGYPLEEGGYLPGKGFLEDQER